jgi:hypothetical protein
MKCPYCREEVSSDSAVCPYCGTGFGQPSVHAGSVSHSGHAGMAVGLILLLVLGGLFAAGELYPLATQVYDGSRQILTSVLCLYPSLCPNSGYTPTQGKASYDQQVLLVFSQDFSSLSYNVTAVPQQDSYGFGPAYLLNGHSDSGYWYQVGLAYNWPLASGTSYDAGFHFTWEVFQPNGTTTNPTLSNIPDNVNANDTVGLSLYFQTSSVVMSSFDYNTGASSSHSYTAGGGSRFVGSSGFSRSNTPTSLMTEWYHPDPNWTTMKQVTYSENAVSVSSASVCISEYVPPNPNSSVYSSCSSPLLLTSTPQPYSYHGLVTYTTQNMFQTGPSA